MHLYLRADRTSRRTENRAPSLEIPISACRSRWIQHRHVTPPHPAPRPRRKPVPGLLRALAASGSCYAGLHREDDAQELPGFLVDGGSRILKRAGLKCLASLVFFKCETMQKKGTKGAVLLQLGHTKPNNYKACVRIVCLSIFCLSTYLSICLSMDFKFFGLRRISAAKFVPPQVKCRQLLNGSQDWYTC